MQLLTHLIRVTCIGLSIGGVLGSVWMISGAGTPNVGYNGVPKEGYLQSRFFDPMMVVPSLETDGKIKNADSLSQKDSTEYQRKIIGSCTGSAPITRVNPDGSVECRQLYSWTTGDENNWGTCQLSQNACGQGVQYREYYCQDPRGNRVADDQCIGPKPQREQRSCNGPTCTCGPAPACVNAGTCIPNTGNPTSLSQGWQSQGTSCVVTCNAGYEWNGYDCVVPPPPNCTNGTINPPLCDTIEVNFSDCNVVTHPSGGSVQYFTIPMGGTGGPYGNLFSAGGAFQNPDGSLTCPGPTGSDNGCVPNSAGGIVCYRKIY